jgi:hypothetical protein
MKQETEKDLEGNGSAVIGLVSHNIAWGTEKYYTSFNQDS